MQAPSPCSGLRSPFDTLTSAATASVVCNPLPNEVVYEISALSSLLYLWCSLFYTLCRFYGIHEHVAIYLRCALPSGVSGPATPACPIHPRVADWPMPQRVQKFDTMACSYAGSIPELYGSLRTMRRFVIGMPHGIPFRIGEYIGVVVIYLLYTEYCDLCQCGHF